MKARANLLNPFRWRVALFRCALCQQWSSLAKIRKVNKCGVTCFVHANCAIFSSKVKILQRIGKLWASNDSQPNSKPLIQACARKWRRSSVRKQFTGDLFHCNQISRGEAVSFKHLSFETRCFKSERASNSRCFAGNRRKDNLRSENRPIEKIEEHSVQAQHDGAAVTLWPYVFRFGKMCCFSDTKYISFNC